MNLSKFGKKLTSHSGILQLMDDLGKAMAGTHKNLLMLGGGNPAHIPEIEQIWRKRLQEILGNGDQMERMLGNYTTQQGDGYFLKTLAKFLNTTYGWPVTEKNIAVYQGSQTTCFFLFNMLAGEMPNGSRKKILLPLVPEYIGYADQGISEDFFVSVKPIIEYLDDHTYKYHIDFENLKITEDIAAICVSRPTNPTGNVISDEEVDKLLDLAKKHNIPLIIDNAYGAPFPHILFTEANLKYDEHVINLMSLSKIGLPGTRTSVIVANEEIIQLMSNINAIAALAPGNVGQHIVAPYIKSGEIIKMSENIIKPFYEKKSKEALAYFHNLMKDSDIKYYFHKSEGALFLWLWLPDLPITSQELYERLKNKGVLIIPGHYFFPGYEAKWKHKNECIRITYSQAEETVKKGLEIIAEEIKSLY